MLKCSELDCLRESKYVGLCGMHYKRYWRHGDATKTLTPTRGFKRIECVVDECFEQSTYSNGLCELHYQRWNRYGRTHNIVNRGSGHWVSSVGYIEIIIDGRRVMEHTYLAEKALGKSLPKGAVVHHMNKKKWDNHTPFNLVICPDQAYHLLIHRRMKELGYENNTYR